MLISQPTILALDFDGVVCNGMAEYFATAWEIYTRLWRSPNISINDTLKERFAKFRPLVETGWEMPVLIRALMLDIADEKIMGHWSDICQKIVRDEDLNPLEVAHRVDGYRDEWIQKDLKSWLDLHEFYPGVVEKIKSLIGKGKRVVIITTKEGRFVTQLFRIAGLDLGQDNIFGKEQKQPKSATLKQLLDLQENTTIWFVEDRWQTLQKIAAIPDLNRVKLYLADWGYNTSAERELAKQDSRVQLISLADFFDWDI